jgi:Holliday junction resolvase RusA-like endonuclease
MPKESKIADIDFHTGVEGIIPSTQEAFASGAYHGEVRKTEKEELVNFKVEFGEHLNTKLADNENFPTDGEVFIFIMQYFIGEKEYTRRDIDNMAKTVLDVLKGRFYNDDSQVKTLLVGKKMDQRIAQNFAYVAIKKLGKDRDADALKIAGIERAVTLFQELKNKGLI